MGRPTAIEIELQRQTGTRSILEAVEHVVADLTKDRRSPVDLSEIARSVGITEIQKARIDCDGMLIPLGDSGYRVVVSDTAPSTRQRFSLAHEIGHAVIHRLIPETKKFETRSVFLPPGSKTEEAFCDAFAARLLMPSKGVLEHAEAFQTFSTAYLKDLSARFNVSLSAAMMRCREMFGIRAGLFLVRVFRSEIISLLDRILLNFPTSPVYLPHGFEFSEDSVVGCGARTRGLSRGFEWIEFGNVKHRLFIEADGTELAGRREESLIATFGPHDFTSMRLLPKWCEK